MQRVLMLKSVFHLKKIPFDVLLGRTDTKKSADRDHLPFKN